VLLADRRLEMFGLTVGTRLEPLEGPVSVRVRPPPQGLERLAAEIQRLALAQGLMRPQAKAPAEPPLPALPAQPGTPARSYRRDKTTL